MSCSTFACDVAKHTFSEEPKSEGQVREVSYGFVEEVDKMAS